jgi:hypothetical protein
MSGWICFYERPLRRHQVALCFQYHLPLNNSSRVLDLLEEAIHGNDATLLYSLEQANFDLSYSILGSSDLVAISNFIQAISMVSRSFEAN